jgi:protein-tyrosine phosphatase
VIFYFSLNILVVCIIFLHVVRAWCGLSVGLYSYFSTLFGIITLFNNILVVCVGNICRSPMAEALLRQALSNANKVGYNISSAGLGALVDHAPDKSACELLLKKGIDISGYKASQINPQMIRRADLIMVMETGHKNAILAEEPSAKGKVFRIGEWGGFDVPDPYRKDMAAFEEALNLIEQGVMQWIQKL